MPTNLENEGEIEMKKRCVITVVLLMGALFLFGCGSGSTDTKPLQQEVALVETIAENEMMSEGTNVALAETILENEMMCEGTKIAISTKTYKTFQGLSLDMSIEGLIDKITREGMVEIAPMKAGALETEKTKYAFDEEKDLADVEFEIWEDTVIAVKYTVRIGLEDTGFTADKKLYDHLLEKIKSGEISTLEQLEKEIGKGYVILKDYRKFKNLESGTKTVYRWPDAGTYHIEASVDEEGNLIGSVKGSVRK